jgi:glutaredoxin 3
MTVSVLIYGKDQCPYTTAAREDHAKRKVAFEYINVVADGAKLKEMLKHSKGVRKVPVIVDGDKVTIGFNGT